MNKLLTLLAAVIVAMVVSSCGNSAADEVVPDSPSTGGDAVKAVIIGLNEEQISMTQDTMTRATASEGKKYYGINIYEKSGKSYKKYAYGVFDGSTAISAIMTEGEKYKVEVMEFKNDEDTLYHKGTTFYQPLMVGGTTPSTLTNAFNYDSSVNLDGLTDGLTKLGAAAADTTWYPRAFRYYGTTEDFDPATGSSVQVNVRRAVFGLHFVITPPQYGTVLIKFLRNRSITINPKGETYDHESVYSFNQIANAVADGYKHNFTADVVWKYNGELLDSTSVTLPVARNVMTTVEIDFSGPGDITQTIEEEDTEMAADTVSYTITAK